MPVINDLDLGPSNPWKLPKSGIHTAVIEIPGGYAIPYGVDSTHPAWRLVFKYQARNSVGQYAALSQNAMEYLGRQLEELSRNYDLQPCYIQLFAGTGLVGGAINQPQDGWYYIANCHVDYTEPWTGVGTVAMDVEFVSPGPPRRIGMWTSGGGLSSNYSGAATNWYFLPLNSTSLILTGVARTGGEGALAGIVSPAVNPSPFVLSATIADWFKGGCRVYDAMAGIGTNAVPAAPTVLNTNWIEVKGIDHRFVGDVVITNGLFLITLSSAASPGVVCYLWNTALGTPGWQQVATLNYQDNSASGSGTLRNISLQRVGLDELSCLLESTTTGGQEAQITLRLQRGSYACRVDFRPKTQANTNANALYLAFPAAPKILWNSGVGAAVFAADNGLAAQSQPVFSTDYGYGAALINNGTYPFLAGWLYQNEPVDQPQYNNGVNVGLGDSSGPALNATRSYGLFAIPLATPQNYQAEAEGGTLGTGWTSQAGAGGNSNALEAKCASGTLTGNADTFGTAFSPPAGTYSLLVRAKVTSAAGNVAEMQVGIWDPTAVAFVASSTFKANQCSTSYVWLLSTPYTLPAANNTRFRAVTAATLGTDWFIDEAVLVPITLANSGPREIWQQWINDRSAKQVVD